VAGPLEFAGLRAFETLGSRWVFSGLLLPQCCPTEIIFSRDGVDPPSSPRWCRCRVVDRDSPSRRATFFNVIRWATRALQARRHGAPSPQPVLRSNNVDRKSAEALTNALAHFSELDNWATMTLRDVAMHSSLMDKGRFGYLCTCVPAASRIPVPSLASNLELPLP